MGTCATCKYASDVAQRILHYRHGGSGGVMTVMHKVLRYLENRIVAQRALRDSG